MMRKTQRKSTPQAPLTVSGIIRAARGTRTQEAYAADLGIRQDLLCKYEKGRVNPPATIIERCMLDVHRLSDIQAPDADMIAQRILVGMAGPEFEPARAILANLLDLLSTPPRHTPAFRAGLSATKRPASRR